MTRPEPDPDFPDPGIQEPGWPIWPLWVIALVLVAFIIAMAFHVDPSWWRRW